LKNKEVHTDRQTQINRDGVRKASGKTNLDQIVLLCFAVSLEWDNFKQKNKVIQDHKKLKLISKGNRTTHPT
jgi:hypothetical protein